MTDEPEGNGPHVEFDTCIIGAGWSGLLACKFFKEAGFNPVVLERNDYIGGVWHHDIEGKAGGVVKSTFTTSSKTTTEHGDFPMPSHYPEFVRHEQVMDYLHSYCEAFELNPHLRLNNGVSKCTKEGEKWRIQTHSGASYVCERLVVAAGVHQEATDSGRGQFGDFPGMVMHSTQLERRSSEPSWRSASPRWSRLRGRTACPTTAYSRRGTGSGTR